MGIVSNVLKTLSYTQRNGVKSAYYAAKERLEETVRDPYTFQPATDEELETQRATYAEWQATADDNPYDFLTREHFLPRISIIVPCYKTPKRFLQAMIESVLAQTYENWELILADASPEISEEEETQEDEAAVHIASVVYSLEDARIHYMKLKENTGISENTNRALDYATGDYVGFLDHDDLLTPDALFEIVSAIRDHMQHLPESGMERLISSKKAGGGMPPKRMMNPVGLVYTDEDKCEENDAGAFSYFDPNRKTDFNLDYLLSNNYICHFLVLRADLAARLRLRAEFDGAQDFDLTLRACGELMKESPEKEKTLKALVAEIDSGMHGFRMHEGSVVHVPKVLYHWRSHVSSTAANPSSKRYAYEAGRKAVQDFLDERHVRCRVRDLPHLGFYRVDYQPDALHARSDIGAVGGKLVDGKGVLVGGAMRDDGTVLYEGLQKGYTGGILHRAVLQQDVDAVDIRNIEVRIEFEKRLNELVNMTDEAVRELWKGPDKGTGALSGSAHETPGTASSPEQASFRTGADSRGLGLDSVASKIAEPDSAPVHSHETPGNTENCSPVLLGHADILRSLILCREIRNAGYRILWDPQKVRELA